MTCWLVTGAAGFIGSNLSSYLLRLGEDVVGIDDFSTGTRANVDRLEGLSRGRFRFIEGLIDDTETVSSAVSDCDVVAHLAGQVSVQHALEFPMHTNRANVTGFLTVAEAAARAGAKRVIYASSCAVYGENNAEPLSESAKTRATTLYAASKLANEIYAESLRSKYPGTDYLGLRFFNIFGPWQDHRSAYAAVMARWIKALREGQRPILFGDGTATRDFCFVDNVCAAIHGVADRPLACSERVFNIGTGVATSLEQLYSVLRTELAAHGITPPPEGPDRRPWRTADLLHSCADIGLARDRLGYRPGIDLAEGVRRLIAEEYLT